ncbi:MAG TPA: flagellar filament outer layer protein FlaA [Armatimonadota bacterium]|nr:flagellar filament outer layer protein FlaA [Armatimonadota bacterium]
MGKLLRFAGGITLFMLLLSGCWADTVTIEDFELPMGLHLGGQLVQPESSLTLSAKEPYDGKQFAEMHYRFAAVKGIQTIDLLTAPCTIKAPIHRVSVAVRGDGSKLPVRIRFMDADKETFQYSLGNLDFTGWRVLSVDMDAAKPDTWGGDNDKVMQYPIAFYSVIIDTIRDKDQVAAPAEGTVGFDAVTVQSEKTAQDTITPHGNYCLTLQNFEAVNEIKPNGQLLQPDTTMQISTEQPYEGKKCVKVHYRFAAVPGVQTANVNINQPITAPIHRIAVALRGDKSRLPIHVRFVDAHGEAHQFSLGSLDFSGWRLLIADLDTQQRWCWGGDGDKVMQYPITLQCIVIDTNRVKEVAPAMEGDIALDDVLVTADKPENETFPPRK